MVLDGAGAAIQTGSIVLNFGTGVAKVKGFISYAGVNTTGAAQSGTAHIHISSDGFNFTLFDSNEIGADEEMSLAPNSTLTLKGMKKPSIDGETSFYWIIDHNVINPQ
jgi:hypothetical protein